MRDVGRVGRGRIVFAIATNTFFVSTWCSLDVSLQNLKRQERLLIIGRRMLNKSRLKICAKMQSRRMLIQARAAYPFGFCTF